MNQTAPSPRLMVLEPTPRPRTRRRIDQVTQPLGPPAPAPRPQPNQGAAQSDGAPTAPPPPT